MAGPMFTVIKMGGICFAGSTCIFAIAAIITVLASIRTLGPDDQYVIHYLNGRDVVNGPQIKVINPFREKTERKAIRIGTLEYMRARNTLNGDVRIIPGHAKIFLGAYEEPDGVMTKIVLKKDQYIRLVDRLSGSERVVKGPDSIVPGAWEESNDGVQNASFVSRDSAVIVLNKADGTKRLHQTTGPFFPNAYEVVVEMRSRVRVLPHETMVVRNAFGRYIIHSGSGLQLMSSLASGNGTGTSFFLEPFEEIVEMQWSSFSEPPEGGLQVVSTTPVTRIDMRARKVFFQYDVRTNDNVALRIEGSIFWQVQDVAKLLNITADPAGDVWYKARSTLISAISKVDLETFMGNFNTLIQTAFQAQANDGFYEERGLVVHSMEVTKYSPTDEATATTLQEIIKETTDRINRLQAQRSENDVKAAKLLADIGLERNRTQLILTQAGNSRLVASNEGEAEGVQLAKAASTFFSELDSSLPDLDERVTLYKLHKQLENQNTRTKHISSGKATLFMTADELNFNLKSTEL
mmetsp:Transcript_29444/g.83910  ORF Transcript_29444/g.83910 Transcript_29444/m.83910 type:complete len:522 (+) Transcript_29444:114-1679(+)